MSTGKDNNGEKRKAIKKATPPYGSQEYWDLRYKKNKDNTPETTTQKDEEVVEKIEADDEAIPYHAWYFTYQDLRPLILPLILGGKDQYEPNEANQSDIADEDETKIDGTDGTTEGSKSETKEPSQKIQINKIPSKNSNQDQDQDDKELPNDHSVDSSSHDEQSSEGDPEEIHDGELDDDSELEDDETEPREGLAKTGPISVLEVGCGDVPLGKDLCIEFIQLSKNTGEKVDAILRNVTCCDYSPTVVNMMNNNKTQLGKHGDTLEVQLDSDGLATLDVLLAYTVVDARAMPFKENTFHLILEKGTLDAMLSDKDEGITNCLKIVRECARVLELKGYIVIVSHLNAHTDNGIDWLNTVVITGLREGGGDKVTWEIEVHGNDGIDLEDQESLSPSGSPGPCVYIIRKLAIEEEATESPNDPPSIPLKFFSY